MGYRRAKPVYVLKFDDPELAELEVRAKGASVGELMDLMDLARLGGGSAKVSVEDIKEIDGLFDLFGAKLLAWNLEDEDGTPAPANAAGLRAQDMDFAMSMIFAWLDAVIGVPAPLGRSSTDGTPYPADSTSMETSLASLSS